jgi:peptidoglycan hydrolase-like protein with peptidoglycan-binding domain
MPSTLRALAVVSCTAILVAGAAASASAAGAGGGPAFTLQPTFGLPGSKITLSGADFTGETGVTINGIAATNVKSVDSGQELTAKVPSGASSGPVVATGAKTLTGPNFTVQQTTEATSALSRDAVTYTHSLVVTGAVAQSVSGDPVAGQPAILQHRAAGSKTWGRAKGTPKKKTGLEGVVRWSMSPAADGAFRVRFLGTHSYSGVTTGGHRYRVSPLLQLKRTRTVAIYSSSQLSGTIRPRLSGTVYLQRLINGAWHGAGKAFAVDGRYSFTITPGVLGARSYRVVRRFDGLHAHAQTHPMNVQVVHRELFLGDSGSDVRALQKRLHKLHYYVGSINDGYGWDTLHAVTAFEKVQGLTPNGDMSLKVWKALNHPKRIHLRHPNAAKYEVEVNIGKQVLLMGKNGHVVDILDTSTAGGYLYTNSEGGTSRAITPTGHFSIQYKLTGTRVSKLGTLYYPSYFTTTGYAIHGEGNGNDGGNVPPYPNSHGCVRITDDAVLHFFSTPYLAVGASVWIYH